MSSHGDSSNKNKANEKSGEVSPILIGKALKGISFPADKRQIIEHASGASEGKRSDVETLLNRLPGRQYESMADIERAVGETGGGSGGSSEDAE